MKRNKPRERFMFGCLLVALMVGIVAVKLWIVSVEERLDKNLAFDWIIVHIENGQMNVLTSHEDRLRQVERTAWAVWDHHAPCDGWPTTQQIARGER